MLFKGRRWADMTDDSASMSLRASVGPKLKLSAEDEKGAVATRFPEGFTSMMRIVERTASAETEEPSQGDENEPAQEPPSSTEPSKPDSLKKITPASLLRHGLPYMSNFRHSTHTSSNGEPKSSGPGWSAHWELDSCTYSYQRGTASAAATLVTTPRLLYLEDANTASLRDASRQSPGKAGGASQRLYMYKLMDTDGLSTPSPVRDHGVVTLKAGGASATKPLHVKFSKSRDNRSPPQMPRLNLQNVPPSEEAGWACEAIKTERGGCLTERPLPAAQRPLAENRSGPKTQREPMQAKRYSKRRARVNFQEKQSQIPSAPARQIRGSSPPLSQINTRVPRAAQPKRKSGFQYQGQVLPVIESVKNYRERQIALTKSSETYRLFQQLRSTYKNESEPKTPQSTSRIPCGAFQNQLLAWKRSLHAATTHCNAVAASSSKIVLRAA